ncbi:MAG: PAS domain S-box protein, partial [Gemmatimonadales bacterium]|nr:PAS domain S-box protein [Gemmatimonadales bacterium]
MTTLWTQTAHDVLARAGRVLGASLDTSETLTALVELLVPDVADAAIIRIGDLARGLVDAEATNATAAFGPRLYPYLRQYPADNQALDGMAQSEEHRRALEALELSSFVILPLMVRGRAIGGLSLLASESRRTFGETTLLLAQELADRAAVALDHARLFRAERASRSRLELLQALTGKLAEADTVAAVAEIALSDGLTALGATVGLVAMISADGTRLDVIAHRGHAPGSMDAWRTVPLDPLIPIADSYLRGEPVFLSDPAERATRYPEFSSFSSRAGYAAGASIPLVAHGRTFGALGIAFHEDRRFDEDERAQVLGVAGQCAAALARNEAAGALRRSEARFRSLFESDLVGVAFWSGPVLTELNGTFLRLLGYAQSEIPAGGIPYADITAPEYQEADQRAFAQVLASGRVMPYRKDFVRKDGSRLPVLVGGGRAGDGGTGVLFALDLTDALRAEAVQRQWSDAFENTSHAVGLTDAQTNRIMVVNRAYASLFGYEPEEMAGRPVSMLYPGDGGSAMQSNIERIEALGHVSFESTYRRKDGSFFPAAVDATLVRATDGSPLYRIVNVEDRTERHRFETELRQAQKMEAVGRLAGGVAHEINNALQGVLGFTAFALRALDNDHPARTDVEQAARSGERARDIAHQLLAFSRRQMLKPEALDVSRVIAEFGMMLKQAIGRERELVSERSGSAVTVFADRGQLEQVLLNLVLNARDATD